MAPDNVKITRPFSRQAVGELGAQRFAVVDARSVHVWGPSARIGATETARRATRRSSSICAHAR